MIRFCAALLLVPAIAVADTSPVLAEEVVAVVEKRSVLLSELEVEARLMRAQSEGAGTLPMPVSGRELREALDRLVDRIVVYAEAERLQVFELAPGEVDRAVKLLRARLGEERLDAFLTEWDVDERTLAELVQRELRVVRYLDGRFRLAARPRESDVQARYHDHPEDYPGRTFEQAAPEIRAQLARERFQKLTDAFIADVRKRARVTVLRDFENPGTETPKSGNVNAADLGARGGTR